MFKILVVLMFICSLAYAETNEKYSYKAFPYHKLSFKDVPAKEFNNTTIVGSCFYQECLEGEEVVKDIFPDGMTGVTFEKCNLDNILIPVDNTIDSEKGGCNRKLKVQNDLSDWTLDKDLKPIEPTDKLERLEKGISIDPKDIPEEKQDESVFKELSPIS